MFKDKVTRLLDGQLVVDKTMPTNSNNMITIITNSMNEEQMYKDQELFKNKIVVDQNEEEKLKKSFVEQLKNYMQQNFLKKQHVTQEIGI